VLAHLFVLPAAQHLFVEALGHLLKGLRVLNAQLSHQVAQVPLVDSSARVHAHHKGSKHGHGTDLVRRSQVRRHRLPDRSHTDSQLHPQSKN
jgi:hypothetical protein